MQTPQRPAYVSIRQRLRGSRAGQSACRACKPRSALHTSAYVSIRQHTSAYVGIRQHTVGVQYALTPQSKHSVARPHSSRMSKVFFSSSFFLPVRSCMTSAPSLNHLSAVALLYFFLYFFVLFLYFLHFCFVLAAGLFIRRSLFFL